MTETTLAIEPVPPARAPALWARILRAVAEAAVAIGLALLLAWLCTKIRVDPINRTGQISGLAGVQFRFAVMAVAVVAIGIAALVLLRGARRDSAVREAVLGLCGAAVAGLAGGAAAGGLVVALHGTPWGLNGEGGDVGRLIGWAKDALAGRPLPDTYPPLPAHLIGWLSQLTDTPVEYAMKDFQILGVAVVPPLAYLAWRMLLTPVWALVIGVTSAMPLIDAYKVYTNAVLIILIPTLIRSLLALRAAGKYGYIHALVVGGLIGAGLGVLFLAYFGWYLWSALGFVVAFLAVLPWRDAHALRRAGVIVLTAGGVFFAITYHWLLALLTKGNGEKDQYFYFDTDIRPTWFGNWFDDRPPPSLGIWPLPGGLGGVDIFTVLLFVGLGIALVLGYRRVDILLIVALITSAWLLRFYLASRMWEHQSVQLYPRTSVQILYGLLLATGLAIMIAVRKSSRTFSFSGVAPRFRTGAVVGVLAGALFLFASMADVIGDHYMPDNDTGNGQLAWRAFSSPQLNGHCPKNFVRRGFFCVYIAPTVTTNGTPILPPKTTQPAGASGSH